GEPPPERGAPPLSLMRRALPGWGPRRCLGSIRVHALLGTTTARTGARHSPRLGQQQGRQASATAAGAPGSATGAAARPLPPPAAAALSLVPWRCDMRL